MMVKSNNVYKDTDWGQCIYIGRWHGKTVKTIIYLMTQNAVNVYILVDGMIRRSCPIIYIVTQNVVNVSKPENLIS